MIPPQASPNPRQDALAEIERLLNRKSSAMVVAPENGTCFAQPDPDNRGEFNWFQSVPDIFGWPPRARRADGPLLVRHDERQDHRGKNSHKQPTIHGGRSSGKG